MSGYIPNIAVSILVDDDHFRDILGSFFGNL